MKNGRRLLIVDRNHCLQGIDGEELDQAGVLEEIPRVENQRFQIQTSVPELGGY